MRSTFVVLLAVILVSTPAFAQSPGSSPATVNLRQAIKMTRIPVAQSNNPTSPRAGDRRSAIRTRSSVVARSAAVAVLAAAGFFGGGLLGAGLENQFSPCECDDPGLKGFVIGAPIGAIAGGVLGFVLSR